MTERGVNCSLPLIGRQRGVDVKGEKNGWEVFVESKGSLANHHNPDTVFGQGQIKTHTYNQIGKLMEYKTLYPNQSIYVMANPDIPRIRKRVNKVVSSINAIGIVQFWVQQDESILVEYADSLKDDLLNLGLIKI